MCYSDYYKYFFIVNTFFSLLYLILSGNKYNKIISISFPQISLNSSGLSYSAISLLSTLFVLYGCIALNKFQLDWRIGVTCAITYAGFLVLAAIIELNVLFVVNLPICPH